MQGKRIYVPDTHTSAVQTGGNRSFSSSSNTVCAPQIKASPKPTVTWLKDSTKLSQAGRISFTEKEEEKGVWYFALGTVNVSCLNNVIDTERFLRNQANQTIYQEMHSIA